MRVLFVYKYLTLGGVETVLRARLDGLAALGIEAHAWFFHDLGGMPLFSGLRERVQLGEPANCVRFAAGGGFDLCCTIDSEEVLAPELAADSPRWVVECHTPYDEPLRYLARLVPRRLRGVLVPSQHQAAVVRSRAPRGLDVRVVPNPLREAFVAPPQPFPAPPPRPVVAWIGRMDALKNWQGFLALGEELLARCPDAELWMAGRPTGPAAELWKRAAGSGVARRLRWYRDLPHDRVPAFLDAVRDSGGVLVSTSRGESFGMTVAEAMARGCAVAVPDRTPLTELVEAGRTGVVYADGSAKAAADAVAGLLADPVLRGRLGGAAREAAVARFSPEVALPRLAKELHRLAAG